MNEERIKEIFSDKEFEEIEQQASDKEGELGEGELEEVSGGSAVARGERTVNVFL